MRELITNLYYQAETDTVEMTDNKTHTAGTQQSQQNKSKSTGYFNKQKNIRGDIGELGHHVYVYGSKNQGDTYLKTTEAIAEYVGREYNKFMRTLVKMSIETVPTEPDEPTGTVTQYAMEKYKKQLSRYYDQLDKYEEYKAKVFVIIKGQCTLTMKNKVESMKDYASWERDDDVIKLLNALKELAFTTIKVQYDYWMMSMSLKRAMNLTQHGGESLAGYYKRFINTVEVTESQWGQLVPTELAKNENDESISRNKFLACVFLAGVDKKSYGKLINELNNAYLTGQKNYPVTVEGAVTLLSHYMSDNNKKTVETENNGETATSFLQEKIVCHKCGKEGHYANQCSENSDKDREGNVNFSGKLKWYR